MPPSIRAYLDQIRSYSIVAVGAGIAVSYVGQFVAYVVVLMSFVSNMHSDDPFQTGVDTHFWGKTILSVLIQGGFMVGAGFATAFLASGQYVQQARDMAIVCAVFYLCYALDFTLFYHKTAMAEYVLAFISVPAAMFGATKSAGSSAT